MKKSDDPGIRRCALCDADVHLCETAEELKQALVNNWCVAMYEKDTEYPALIGDVDSVYFLNCNNRHLILQTVPDFIEADWPLSTAQWPFERPEMDPPNSL